MAKLSQQKSRGASDGIKAQSHFAAPIKRPVCPKCNTTMMLARLTPGHVGFEIQSFECPKCYHQLTVEVGEVDPMKSADGWLKSELRPPE